MPDVVCTFGRREERDGRGDQLTHTVEAARPRGAQHRFQFREGLFDGIEIRTVGRQEADVRADAFDRGAHLRLFVDRQVVEHHHVATVQRGHQDLLDVGEKRRTVDRSVEDRGRGQAVEPQRRDDGVRLPVTARGVIVQARAAGTAPIAAEEIGGDAAFIQKDVLAHVAQGLRGRPLAARRGDVRATLFVGAYGFF